MVEFFFFIAGDEGSDDEMLKQALKMSMEQP